MNKVAEHFGRRGILVLISDLYEEPDAILEAIGPLRFRGHDMIVFHLLDAAELNFEYADPSAFEDLESGEQIPIVPEALASQYRELVQAHVDALTERFTATASTTAWSTRPRRSITRCSRISSTRERLTRVR